MTSVPAKYELYGGKYILEFNEANHRYKVNGVFKQGVTTMLKLLDKGDGLMQWAVNMAIEAMQAGESAQVAKRAYLQKRDDAGDVGKRVHSWIENYNQGIQTTIDDEMKPSVDAYLRWEKEYQVEHLTPERVLYSELHDYCGTVDDPHMQNGLRVINDYKTGKPDFEYDHRTKSYTGKIRPRIEHLLQDALYDQCMIEEDGVGADKYAVTYLTKDGKLYYCETDRVKEIRELALQVVKTYKLLKIENRINEYVNS